MGEIQLTRRGLLGSFAALVGAAVIPGSTKALTMTDHERLLAMLERGLVENQEFILHDFPGFELGGYIRDVVIQRSTFKFTGRAPNWIFNIGCRGGGHLAIQHCLFDMSNTAPNWIWSSVKEQPIASEFNLPWKISHEQTFHPYQRSLPLLSSAN